ncbi:protein ADP-ribosyltransferase PARP3-like [Hordeum vulgare subsp. vulgare]|uniref:protein ADP-ribosyltransferase PARP3-like n=1 Tax=Hordeum vulgare subsp. vulgare TaxID=112509 RepID=UPI001D1A4EC9|nr:protein ADP-ribosyltransferase PARP3-like [Hordeum vulgare subsp. vulgare]XP_044947301.1 protein ADP-ribosyltransferase PARP3-like [Hordeum vulgare subsp. vulgare]XP_044947302.1 protein ADP-ribosyltransferase PARP3-like [Hordeum vulgare subsp. vulgare]
MHRERGTPVVSENWIVDSIQKKEAQPLAAYDIVSDVVPEGTGLPLDKLDPSEEAIETLAAELKLARKRSVHKDSKLGKDGGCIFEKDDIIYNSACSICDLGSETNQLYIMQLIMLPEEHLHLFYKKGPIGHDHMAEERVEDFGNRVNDAIKEFARLFKEVTGNDFEPWEREKKFEKKSMKMYPLDMDVGFDVRHGGASWRYALTEMAQDLPDLPIGMLTDAHLKRGRTRWRRKRF